uniref:Uncharacterized protein n=1 Tax=Nelumbo nucifera TaxID=4432 RepID=A0A822Y764_NELNU|nr:TPA_asm: hypothetical protein HUJ06_028333 [Nelumbo nucifera]
MSSNCPVPTADCLPELPFSFRIVFSKRTPVTLELLLSEGKNLSGFRKKMKCSSH